MSERLEGQVGKPPGAGDPAADLADVWEMLDVLPAASAAADMAATTVDLMAVRLSPQGSSPGSRGWLVLQGWLAPTATVVGALIAGIVLGRVTIPDPVVENLPFIRHIDLLQEAGSLEFLEQLAELMTTDRPVQPRWFRLARDPESVRAEALEFDAEVDVLRQDFAAQTTAARAARLAAVGPERRDRLEKSAETFFSLSPIDRREVEAVARGLADPRGDRLREAARLWHVIVAATPPPMRRGIVEMRLEDRMEWLQRPAGGEGRFDPRPDGRGRDDDRRPGPPLRRPTASGNPNRSGPRLPNGVSPPGQLPRIGPPAVPGEIPAPPR